MIIWLASYPKSGNTWVRSIVNQLAFHDIKKNEDVFDGLNKIRRYPAPYDMPKLPKISEVSTDDQKKKVIEYSIKNWKKTQDRIYEKKKLQFLKTHNVLCKLKIGIQDYQFTDILNSIGVIHIVRDPRNIVTSVKNHFNHESIEESIDMMKDPNRWTGFKNNEVPQLLSSWNNHFNSWKQFPKNNFLIKYEDLIRNIDHEIKRLINFISSFIKIEISQKEIDTIIQNSSFVNFSKLEQKGKFKENSLKINGNKNKFFYLGPKNDWQQILKKESASSITSTFEKEMIELGYL
tara:strand:+ start:119 stop:991 length:873 start_codon:yes stop_codon:yes gene_type:complete